MMCALVDQAHTVTVGLHWYTETHAVFFSLCAHVVFAEKESQQSMCCKLYSHLNV